MLFERNNPLFTSRTNFNFVIFRLVTGNRAANNSQVAAVKLSGQTYFCSDISHFRPYVLLPPSVCFYFLYEIFCCKDHSLHGKKGLLFKWGKSFSLLINELHFVSFVALCILLIHFLLKTKFHYLPESVAVVFLGKFLYL